jgi:maltose O-acetyltransferase
MGEMKDRMLAGQDFRVDDEELAADAERAGELTALYNAELDPERRRDLLDQLLGSVGGGTTIRSEFRFDYGYRISVGAFCFVGWGAVFQDTGPINVGEAVLLGPNVSLLTAVHPLQREARRAGWQRSAPITIEDNAWLGGGVIVLPGVTVGENTVIGAGSVVTEDVPPGVLALGNPARVVRRLATEEAQGPAGESRGSRPSRG